LNNNINGNKIFKILKIFLKRKKKHFDLHFNKSIIINYLIIPLFHYLLIYTLFIIYYLLFIIYYLLFIIYYFLFLIYLLFNYLLFNYLLFIYSLFIIYYSIIQLFNYLLFII